VQATDAETKTYKKFDTFDSGEPVPVGLAADLYAAWSQLHYSGEITLMQEDCGGTAIPGKRLRLTGGLAAWATMDALIQQTEEDIGTGKTTISFGPPAHLGVDELMSLVRTLSNRRVSMSAGARVSGESDDKQGNIPLSGSTAGGFPAGNSGGRYAKIIVGTAADDTIQIQLDPSDMAQYNALTVTTVAGKLVGKMGWVRAHG